MQCKLQQMLLVDTLPLILFRKQMVQSSLYYLEWVLLSQITSTNLTILVLLMILYEIHYLLCNTAQETLQMDKGPWLITELWEVQDMPGTAPVAMALAEVVPPPLKGQWLVKKVLGS